MARLHARINVSFHFKPSGCLYSNRFETAFAGNFALSSIMETAERFAACDEKGTCFLFMWESWVEDGKCFLDYGYHATVNYPYPTPEGEFVTPEG